MNPRDPIDPIDPPPPMLILGEDQPDVEDTTPEELQRQQHAARRELERLQREAELELERRQQEVQRELQEERAATERDLAQKKHATERELRRAQEQVDRAQRDLYRQERRLRKRLSQHGLASPSVPLVSVAKDDPPPAPSAFGDTWVRTLTGTAMVAALLSGFFTGQVSTDTDAQASFVAADQARLRWQQVGLQLDEDLSRNLAGQDVELIDGVPASLALVDAAAAAYEPEHDFYIDNFAEDVPGMLREGINPVRALTIWSDLRRNSNYVVSRHDVEELREATMRSSPIGPITGAIAVVALLLLLVLAWRAKAWSAHPLLALALVLAIVILVQQARPTGVDDADEAHGAAVAAITTFTGAVERDLEVAYALRAGDRDDPAFWTTPHRPAHASDDADQHTPARDAYTQARAALGAAVDTPQVYAAGVHFSEAAQVGLEERATRLEAARTAFVSSNDDAASSGAAINRTLGALAALAAGAALVVSALRGRREGKDPR